MVLPKHSWFCFGFLYLRQPPLQIKRELRYVRARWRYGHHSFQRENKNWENGNRFSVRVGSLTFFFHLTDVFIHYATRFFFMFQNSKQNFQRIFHGNA